MVSIFFHSKISMSVLFWKKTGFKKETRGEKRMELLLYSFDKAGANTVFARCLQAYSK